MRRGKWWLAWVLPLGLSASALAVGVGEKLFIRAKNTKMLKEPTPASPGVAILQPGDQVTWLGKHEKDKKWHKVRTAGGKEGVVFQTNLSTTPPSQELSASGAKLDAQAFASSGAAVRGLSEVGEKYASSQPDLKAEAEKLRELERLAKQVQQNPKEIAAHNKAVGLVVAGGER